MTRVKPTDKYREYEDTIRAYSQYVEKQLNGEVIDLITVDYNVIYSGVRTLTVQVTPEDWAEEVQVYWVTESRRPGPRKYFSWHGRLPNAIKKLEDGKPWWDNDCKGAFTAVLEALRQYQSERFDAEGKRLGETQ
jgi:hypothetical protein